jgi:hypothetical protein
VSDGSNDYDTDKYGYYVFFGLSNGSNTLDLTYPYGWDLTINASISNASIIITAPIPMVVCDYNSDGYINGRDYANFLTASVQPGDTNFKYYDINKDGVKNSSDWQVVWGLIGDQRPSNRSNNDSEQPNNDSTDNSSENSSSSGIENLNGDDD